MATTIIISASCCVGGNKMEKWTKDHECLAFSAIALDLAATIILLVVGILGACSVIGMPPAAAYSMIAASAVIGFVPILGMIGDCLNRLKVCS